MTTFLVDGKAYTAKPDENLLQACLGAGLDRVAAIRQTTHTQLRPVMMTCIVACVGLIPAAISTGIGSQVQRPLALVVVGGMLLAPALILIVLPILILRFSGRRPASQTDEGMANEGEVP